MAESEREPGAGNNPFFDGCPLMALIAGPDGRIARANASLCEALGHAEAELADRTLPDLFEAPDRDGAEAMLSALPARGSEGSFTGRAPRKDGAIGWLRLHARRAPDGVSVFALVMDITHWKQRDDERRRTEEALAQSQRELRAQLDLIESQRTAIRSMSMPIIEVSQGVLAMPVIGVLDSVRAAQATEALLDAVVRTGASHVVVDLTGAEGIEASTADALVKVVLALELVGARVLVSGIQPDVAGLMVSIGVDLSRVVTVRNLREAIRRCMREAG